MNEFIVELSDEDLARLEAGQTMEVKKVNGEYVKRFVYRRSQELKGQ